MNNEMIEQMTEDIYFQKGYDKGFADAQEILSKKFEKILNREIQQLSIQYKIIGNKLKKADRILEEFITDCFTPKGKHQDKEHPKVVSSLFL